MPSITYHAVSWYGNLKSEDIDETLVYSSLPMLLPECHYLLATQPTCPFQNPQLLLWGACLHRKQCMESLRVLGEVAPVAYNNLHAFEIRQAKVTGALVSCSGSAAGKQDGQLTRILISSLPTSWFGHPDTVLLRRYRRHGATNNRRPLRQSGLCSYSHVLLS